LNEKEKASKACSYLRPWKRLELFSAAMPPCFPGATKTGAGCLKFELRLKDEDSHIVLERQLLQAEYEVNISRKLQQCLNLPIFCPMADLQKPFVPAYWAD
jgi:hypothetical protein